MDLTSLHRFHIAPGYDPAHPETWFWTDRSADVRHVGGTPVTITGGRSDETGTVNPGSATFEVDNAGGHYCTRNPYGRWYGLLARNCPARWGTITGAATWSTNATNGWGTPDVGTSWTLAGTASEWSASGGYGIRQFSVANVSSSADLNGANARDVDLTVVVSPPVVATGASMRYSVLARRAGAGNNLLFALDCGVGGVLSVTIWRDLGAGLITLGSASAGTYSAGQRIKMRVMCDGDDLRMRVWPEASQEPTTWTATASDTLCTGSGIALHSWLVSGNTNTTPVQFRWDNLEVEAVEISGTIPAFPVRWDPTATVSWAPLEIAGIGRRLGQGSPALRSPMYRQISALSTLVGYWPIEDGSAATAVANTVPGGLPGVPLAMQLGGTGPAGSAAAATFTNPDPSSRVSGTFLPASTSAGWQISWSCKLSALPTSQTQMMSWTTSNGYKWAVNLNSGVYNVVVVDVNGNSLTDTQVSFGGGSGSPDQWVTFRLKATASGGTVTAAFAWFVQGSSTPWGYTPTFTGTVGALRTWSANGNASMGGASICHVFGVTTAADDLQSYAALRSFDGYVGELAAARINRLCGEQGVPLTLEAGASEPMGAQRPAAFMSLLRECEAADSGILYEAGAGLGYRPRTARYNRPVTMTLSISGLDLGDPAPEPTDDDQRVSNEWTVNRDGGSEYTAADAEHIALNGHYPQSTTLNVADDSQLPDQAQWRVHMGTWGEMRWPQITLDLTDRPSLLTAWRGRPFGPRVVVTGVPAQGPIGDNVDLIVEGWTQEIRSDSWRVTLNCSPARIWDVAVFDSAAYRYDSASTTLPSQVAAGATTFTISTVNLADTWSRLAASQPYDLLISGERITVPVGGMGAVSGTGPYTQVVTGATRAVNGISKILPAGAEVHTATPGRYAL